MRDLYPALYRKIVHPAYHWLKRDGLNRALHEVLAVDSLGAGELVSIQRRKLGRLLTHARERVPYYRDVIPADAAGNIERGASLSEVGVPILDKALIRAQLPRLVADDAPPGRLKANSTSGSTGEPMRFYTDIGATVWRRAVDVRNRRWLGIEFGEREAMLWGSQIDSRLASSLRGRLHAFVTRRCALDAYDLSEARMAAYLRRLQAFRPALLTGYPSVLARFGQWCDAEGERIEGLRAIISSAEALHEHQRETICRTLHAPVYNRYGCREVGCIAHERPGSRDLLINADRVAVELVDGNGGLCAPGDVGHILVTDLDSFAMPLIRYRIGDLAVASDRLADDPYPRFSQVEGRSLDVVRSPDGRAVGGTFWTILLRSRPGLRQFQVVQEGPASLKILYLADPAVPVPDFDYYREGIATTCGSAMRVEFEEVEQIAAEPNGKFRIVKSMLEVEDGAAG